MDGVEQVLNASGQAGVAITLIIGMVVIIWLLRGAFIEGMRLWRDAAKERNIIDQKRNEIDEKVANTLDAVNENLTRLKEGVGETRNLVEGFRRDHQGLHATTLEQHATIMAKVEPIERIEAAIKVNQATTGELIAAITRRLDDHQKIIDGIAKQVTRDTEENTLRAQLARLIITTTEVGQDVKRLLQPEIKNENQTMKRTV